MRKRQRGRERRELCTQLVLQAFCNCCLHDVWVRTIEGQLMLLTSLPPGSPSPIRQAVMNAEGIPLKQQRFLILSGLDTPTSIPKASSSPPLSPLPSPQPSPSIPHPYPSSPLPHSLTLIPSLSLPSLLSHLFSHSLQENQKYGTCSCGTRIWVGLQKQMLYRLR